MAAASVSETSASQFSVRSGGRSNRSRLGLGAPLLFLTLQSDVGSASYPFWETARGAYISPGYLGAHRFSAWAAPFIESGRPAGRRVSPPCPFLLTAQVAVHCWDPQGWLPNAPRAAKAGLLGHVGVTARLESAPRPGRRSSCLNWQLLNNPVSSASADCFASSTPSLLFFLLHSSHRLLIPMTSV